MGLLRSMGYRRLRHYRGGMEDWVAHGLPLETRAPSRLPRSPARRADADGIGPRALDLLAGLSIGRLLGIWLSIVSAFGLVYWIAQATTGRSLAEQGRPVPATLAGLGDCLYFSFVTAVSIGYGDIAPLGWVRALAVAEGALGLLLFGCVISKLVSRRQEQLMEEVHRISFEGRLGRVQTNLHLVLSDLQSLAVEWSDEAQPDRRTRRLESLAGVFVAELRAVHDLLYRPQQSPDEDVLDSILGSLGAGLSELHDLIERVGRHRRSPGLEASLRSVRTLCEDICSDCVPRSHAERLRAPMDRVQELARSIR